jgi:hypothetical protein
MSYDTMDHAGWVERNIAASKRGRIGAADRRRQSEGRGWFAAPDALNPFQCRAITILGVIGGGIYNAPIEWDSVCWHHPEMLRLNWRHSMSTFDFSELTVAVLLAHDAAIRLSITPKMRWLEIVMHERRPRQPGDGSCQGHPTVDEAVERHRRRFPIGHHIHFPIPEVVA